MLVTYERMLRDEIWQLALKCTVIQCKIRTEIAITMQITL